ncbi:response regulator [Vibrio sp. WJH972]
MEKLNLICIDDEREVLDAVLNDLDSLSSWVYIEDCESANEASELMEELDAEGDFVALVISDHIMPIKTGVELLTEISQDDRFRQTRKILLTGQATHSDTITAINHARIDSYFEKPWTSEQLVARVRTLITEFVFDKGLDYSDYQMELDQAVVLDRLR